MKLTVVTPYKQRLGTLRVVLSCLAEQTLEPADFEVIIGAMEYSDEYVRLCRQFATRLNIVSVLLDREWNCGQARNLALRQARGDVTVFLDADMALPPDCLRGLYDRYFTDGAEICVLGQSLGYDNVVEQGADGGDPAQHYREVLAGLAAAPERRHDQRWTFEPLVLPWTIVWMGLVALPTATVRRHELTFDEGFRGWGGEDQEWGYRVGACGIPIVRGEDVWGVHLPHVRSVAANFASFDANKWYFLTKWPVLDVELYRAFDGWQANRLYADLQSEVAAVSDGRGLGVARRRVDGRGVLWVGLMLGDEATDSDTLPLVGLALPYPDGSFTECRVLRPILGLSERYRQAVLREAARVAYTVVLPVVRT
jgi:glycosyltransferase involved in cell wall biosynthesis